MPFLSDSRVSSPTFLPFTSQSLDTHLNINKQTTKKWRTNKQIQHILKLWWRLFACPFWSTLNNDSQVLSPQKHIVRLLRDRDDLTKKRLLEFKHFDLGDCPDTSTQRLITFPLVTIIISPHNWFYTGKQINSHTLGEEKEFSGIWWEMKGNQMPALRDWGEQKS